MQLVLFVESAIFTKCVKSSQIYVSTTKFIKMQTVKYNTTTEFAPAWHRVPFGEFYCTLLRCFP